MTRQRLTPDPQTPQNADGPAGNFRGVLILALGFGLVGIDRFLISTMFPAIARDLHLGYGDIGTIAGALAISWGIAALLMGSVADRIGRRKVLVGSLVIFSALIGLSGLATGLAGLVLVRIVMGLADGAFTPASISATIACSQPSKRGRNIGVQQMMLPLFGLGLAPLVVAFLLHVVNWRWIFVLFLVPGLIIARLTARFVPDGRDMTASTHPHGSLSWTGWKGVVGYRNIRVLMVLMLCSMTCLITTSAFMPSFLIDHLKLGDIAMGTIMSAIGLGATAGSLLLPWASDRLGRKPVVISCMAGTIVSLLLLNSAGASVMTLFGCMCLVHFFNFATVTLTVGPICAETVPERLMATASGMVIACGELFGGGLAPMLAGHFAEHFGIDHLLYLPIIVLTIGLLLSFMLSETRSVVRD